MKIKILLCLFIGFATEALADTRVNVVGLFSNKAVVMINGGSPKSISAGQTVSGVKLVSADSSAATFIIEGKRQVLKMGQAASVAPSAAPTAGDGGTNSPVNLYADSRGHFYGNLSVNGTSLKYLVDTGATTVAMNSGDAKFAKIDYEKGQVVQSSTASGISNGYLITLNTIKIGGIVLNNVQAVVIEGGFPQDVLLGMSVLNRLDMKRDNAIMTLKKKY